MAAETPSRPAGPLTFLGPLRDRPVQRLVLLFAGLVAFGVSNAMLLLAELGVGPWDVLHQGLSRTFGLGVGTWAILISFVLLVLWVPLRQRPGLGTLANAVVVGLVIDGVLAVADPPTGWPVRITLLVGGVLLNAVATGAYIGAGLGPGPRDGLTTGLAARGHSIRVVRTSIEVAVLALGWLLGGTVGLGTVLYAGAIGPLTHLTIPRLRLRDRAVRGAASAPRRA